MGSLHLMYKVKLATLAYKIFHDCTPPSMGHILTKKTSPIHHLCTIDTVTVPRFSTYFMENSIAFRSEHLLLESPHFGSRKGIQRQELY